MLLPPQIFQRSFGLMAAYDRYLAAGGTDPVRDGVSYSPPVPSSP